MMEAGDCTSDQMLPHGRVSCRAPQECTSSMEDAVWWLSNLAQKTAFSFIPRSWRMGGCCASLSCFDLRCLLVARPCPVR